MKANMKTALTIAGSDCSGGAGIQADLKTMTAHGVYGMSVITSVTAQNTMGVYGVYDMDAECVAAQLDAVFSDIFPDSVKIGMTSNADIIGAVAEKLRLYKPKNIVLDPVMISTSGHSLLAPDAAKALCCELFPLADIITPNIPEAQTLTGFSIETAADMETAALKIAEKYNVRVLLKGGHFKGECADLLADGTRLEWFGGIRVDNPNTHGTGCTLSSALASNLALGKPMREAVSEAKKYVADAISDMLDLGRGNGPINHTARLFSISS